MQKPNEYSLMNVLRRIGFWFVSLFLAICLFSLLFNLLFGGFHPDALVLIFRITMVEALPVWCLFLPVVIAVKDAEKRRSWLILLGGSLIGPVSVILFCLFLQLRGGNPQTIWSGDPLAGLGGISEMLYSLIVGFMTTSFYVIALRVLHRRSIASNRNSPAE